MAIRRRTLLLVAALGFGALTGPLAGTLPAGAQDFTTTTVAGTDTTLAGDTSTTVAEATSTTASGSQTLVDTGSPTESRILTESRRVLAAIAGLVAVALALMLLTIRYWRSTRPVPLPAVEASPAPVAAALPAADDGKRSRRERKAEGRKSRRSVAGADHPTVDENWEPRATGEHGLLNIPETSGTARPGRAARAKALGLSAKR